MNTTLSHLKEQAARQAEQLRKVSRTLTLDLIVDEEVEDVRAERDEAKQHAIALEAIDTVAVLLEPLPDALSGMALAALQDVVRLGEAFLARECIRATLRRAAEFERDLPY